MVIIIGIITRYGIGPRILAFPKNNQGERPGFFKTAGWLMGAHGN